MVAARWRWIHRRAGLAHVQWYCDIAVIVTALFSEMTPYEKSDYLSVQVN